MRRVVFAVPGDIDALTGGYGYDRRIVAELRWLGWEVELVALGDGFPRPSDAQRDVAQQRLAATPADCPIVIDGLAFGVLPEVATVLQATRPVVALVHHPLAFETNLAQQEMERLHDSERIALAAARSVIVTSPATADLLTGPYNVPPDRIEVILPGTDRVPFSVGSGGPLLHLLAVGAVGARKGFDLLVEALARITHLPWRLTIAGDRGRDAEAVMRLDAAIARHRLEDRIDCTGAVSSERLADLYARADLFVLASRFEGYGMAYAEALAHGLPVVGTTGGAIPQTVPVSAGRLVPPGDVAALAEVLRELIENDASRRALAAGARAHASTLPTWACSGAQFGRALERLL